MKKWISVGILASLVIGMVLMSGCTSSQPTSPATPRSYQSNPTTTQVAEKEVTVTNGEYSAHGLKFQFALAEQGNVITYKDLSGESSIVIAQDNKKLLKFFGTVTSIDGDQSFYQLLQLMDDEGNTYNPLCPLDYNKNCKNQDSLDGLHEPISGQKVSGILIFSVPKTVSHVNLVYNKFVTNDNPKILKFSFNL